MDDLFNRKVHAAAGTEIVSEPWEDTHLGPKRKVLMNPLVNSGTNMRSI